MSRISRVFENKDGFRVELANKPGQGQGVVGVFPAGGGFRIYIPTEVFLEDFREVDTSKDEFKLVTVAIDDGTRYTAYCSRDRWNGWACPWFPETEAQKVFDELNEPGTGCEVRWVTEDKVEFHSDYQDEGEHETWHVQKVKGIPVPVIAIGDGWCWDIVDEEAAIHEFAFDMVLQGAVRVKARTESEARGLIAAYLEAADCNGGAWPDGSPILFEATVRAESLSVYEIDGEAV